MPFWSKGESHQKASENADKSKKCPPHDFYESSSDINTDPKTGKRTKYRIDRCRRCNQTHGYTVNL